MPDALKLTSLPLFPLGAVLYPGGTLPLRIFEVRYLDMVRKCHRSGAPFGVVLLTRGSEVTKAGTDATSAPGSASEAFCPVGTLATITQCEAPQPGLLVVRCTGTRRFRITRSEKLKHGLWIGDVTLLPDDQAVGLIVLASVC